MPRVAEDVFIADGALVIGDVSIGPGTSIWYNTVVRGDVAPITIGRDCNIQDNSTVHGSPGVPTILGDGVSVGHNAVIHSCTVGDGALIAIQAVVLTGAVVGAGSMVGAGAVVGEGKTIPPRSLALGVPARVVRELTEEDLARMAETTRHYVGLAQEHKSR
jgi:carbonic anhydrase/acetyltransferase-like protein (isoleucine patch superfamily)